MTNVKDIFDRLKEVYKVKNNKDLSEKIGIKYQTFNTWIKRNKVPYEKLVQIGQNDQINLNWLLTGKGSMHLQEPATAQNINGNGVIISGTNQGTLITGDINISIQKHKKEVTQKEDDLLEAYRTLPSDLQDYYYHQIKADAIKVKRKNES